MRPPQPQAAVGFVGAHSRCEKAPHATVKDVRGSREGHNRSGTDPLKVGLEFGKPMVLNGLG